MELDPTSCPQQAFSQSMAVTLGIMAALAFTILAVSLREWLLPVYGFVSAALVVATVVGLSLGLYGEISHIEVVAVLVGCSCALDYVVHVLHMYICEQAAHEPIGIETPDTALQVRIARVAFAHKSASRAVIASAGLRTAPCQWRSIGGRCPSAPHRAYTGPVNRRPLEQARVLALRAVP